MLLAGAILAGCQALPSPLPPPPSERVRAELGAIGLAPPRAPQLVAVTPPMAGVGKGLAFGFARGVVLAPAWTAAGIGAGGQGGFIPGAILGGFVGAGIAVVYLPVSTLAGAGTVESPQRIAQARPTIALVLRDFDLPGRLRRATIAAAARNAHRRLRNLQADPAAAVDTRIELTVEAIHGRSQSPWTLVDLNAPFPIRVRTRARIVRVADGTVLHDLTVEYSNELDVRTYVGWAADRGQRLRESLGRAADTLAAFLVDYWFLYTTERWWATAADAAPASRGTP